MLRHYSSVRCFRQELQSLQLRTKPAMVVEFLRGIAPAFVPGTRSLRRVDAHATEVAAALRHREKVLTATPHLLPSPGAGCQLLVLLILTHINSCNIKPPCQDCPSITFHPLL